VLVPVHADRFELPRVAAQALEEREHGAGVAVPVTDDATGEVIFEFENPGFDKNGVATETCVVTARG
jgi:hypothetical protein